MNVLLGDFDARVGSRENVDEEWSSVRGPHGFGCANDSGKELLTFLLCIRLQCAKPMTLSCVRQCGLH